MSCVLGEELSDYRETSKAAQEGTEAHHWTEMLLRGEDISECPDANMVEAAYGMLRLCKALEKKCGGFEQVRVEEHIALSDRIYGTADFAAVYAGGKRALIVDLKYGEGIPVSAKDNPQLICYALCLRKTLGLDVEQVTVVIYQPRAFNGDGDTDSDTFSREELDEWEEKLVSASDKSHAVMEGKVQGEYVPGSWCTFCPGVAICAAGIHAVEEKGLAVMTDITKKKPVMPDVNKLTTEQLEFLVEHKEMIIKTLKKGEELLFKKAMQGEKLQNFRVGEGRAYRRWVFKDDPKKMARLLKRKGVKDPYKDPVLKGVTEVEKEIGKGAVDSLTVKPPGNPKLVKINSRAAEIEVDTRAKDVIDTLD